MNAKLLLVLVALFALQTGCGKRDAPQRAEQPVSDLDRVAEDTRKAMQREADRVHDNWNSLITDAKQSVNKAQNDLQNQSKKQRDEMAEYAAQMAEDAKDRALDIPDVLDEFFGAPSEFRRGSRSERPRR